jgi:hypothetical protein
MGHFQGIGAEIGFGVGSGLVCSYGINIRFGLAFGFGIDDSIC